MNLCPELGKFVENVIKAGENFSNYSFDQSVEGQDVIYKVKEFLKIRNGFKKAKKDFEYNLPENRVLRELDACRGDQDKVAEVAKQYPEYIATDLNSIKDNTLIYIGELYYQIFEDLPSSVKHIYVNYPFGKVELVNLEIGGISADKLKQKIDQEWTVDPQTRMFLRALIRSSYENKKIFQNGGVQKYKLVILRVEDIVGYKGMATVSEVKWAVQKLGLKIPPHLTALFLKYKDADPDNAELKIMTDKESVFTLDTEQNKLAFVPAQRFGSQAKFVFLRQKVE